MSESMKTPKTLNKGWWISLGIVVVVAILAVVIFVKPAPKTPAPIAEPTTSTSATAQAIGGCNVRQGDTSSKPAMPKDLRWEAAKGITWPVSDTYGPTQDKDGYGVCFARSPLGAALAMVSIYGQANTQDPNKVLEFYALDSVGKTAALNQPSSESNVGADAGPIAFAGFSTDSFTPDEAQITLVIAAAGTSTGYVGFPSTMVWVDGDWKLKILDNGETFAGAATNPVAGQFTPWGGSNGM